MSPALLRIWRSPAVQALLLQALAFAPMLGLVYLLARAGHSPSFLQAALIQGGCACALSWWRGQAPWWLLIQAGFAPALLAARVLALPPPLYLALFVFLLALYWSTFRTQVPYYPSGQRVWDEVVKLLPAAPAPAVIDIGSGLGGLALELARRRPDARVTGIELAPLPWFYSWLRSRWRARLGGNPARFIRGDYEKLNFADYDVVFAYLSPAAMSQLWRKAAAEMRPGCLLLSYEFLITEKSPDLILMPTGRGAPLNVWHF